MNLFARFRWPRPVGAKWTTKRAIDHLTLEVPKGESFLVREETWRHQDEPVTEYNVTIFRGRELVVNEHGKNLELTVYKALSDYRGK